MKKYISFALFALLLIPSLQLVQGREGEIRGETEVEIEHGNTIVKERGILNTDVKSLFRGSNSNDDNKIEGRNTDDKGGLRMNTAVREKIQFRVGDDDEKRLSLKMKLDRRYDWAIQSLNSMYTRLNDVYLSLKAKGTVTGSAEADLATARVHIDAAAKASADLKAFVVTVKNSTSTPNADGTTPTITDSDKQKIKDMAKTAKDAIITAHASLRQVRSDLSAAFTFNASRNNSNQ